MTISLKEKFYIVKPMYLDRSLEQITGYCQVNWNKEKEVTITLNKDIT